MILVVASCGPAELDTIDEIYFRWDGRRVVCAAGIDTVSGNSLASVRAGLDRALAEDEVLLLFTHRPGETIPLDELEAVVSYAAELGVPPVTFTELAAGGPPRPGYAISLDDNDVDAWWDSRELLARHGARVTFFVSRYDRITEARKEKLRILVEEDGHDIQAHSVDHLRAPVYVEEHGLAAYLADEALPSLDALRADGYDPVAYAYPFGSRTGELDEALLDHVAIVRSVTFTSGAPLISDPCPE